ncbi:MAG: Ig-like domain-containing protein [Oscillospiraceae bacterium]|nr:Ig-like domain-containing protein [Oscillospiraceae bacterium]
MHQKHPLKKLLAISLSLLLWAAAIPATVAAAEEAPAVVQQCAEYSLVTDTLEKPAASDQLLSGYLLEDNGSAATVQSASTFSNREKLTGMNKKVYDLLKKQVTDIAAGKRASTKLTISLKDVGLDRTWTAKDLGLSALVSNGKLSSKITETLEKKYDYDPVRVVRSLIRDCPYEFYWAGSAYQYNLPFSSLRYHYDGNTRKEIVSLGQDLAFTFTVTSGYAKKGSSTTVDTAKTAAPKKAMKKAKAIVSAAAKKSDDAKLRYYAQQIVKLTDYNHDAVSFFYDGDEGNPWQLIWVFDGDPATKVVCEGYAKAFQYLCELTTFQNQSLRCYSVTGLFRSSTSVGPHMWNIVSMGSGKNYLVDVTNCDRDTVLDTSLFLASPLSGSVSGGYVFSSAYGNSLSYAYDDQTSSIYTTKELTMASTPYVPPKSISSVTISAIPNQTYTGKAKTPALTVKDGSKTLKKGRDYTVTYQNNQNAGTAKAVVKGMGRYDGTKTVTFQIEKASQVLKVKASATTLPKGKTAKLSVSGQKGKLSYRSADPTTATVNSSGTITAKKAGTVKITVTAAATKNDKSATKTIAITVTPSASQQTAK